LALLTYGAGTRHRVEPAEVLPKNPSADGKSSSRRSLRVGVELRHGDDRDVESACLFLLAPRRADAWIICRSACLVDDETHGRLESRASEDGALRASLRTRAPLHQVGGRPPGLLFTGEVVYSVVADGTRADKLREALRACDASTALRFRRACAAPDVRASVCVAFTLLALGDVGFLDPGSEASSATPTTLSGPAGCELTGAPLPFPPRKPRDVDRDVGPLARLLDEGMYSDFELVDRAGGIARAHRALLHCRNAALGRLAYASATGGAEARAAPCFALRAVLCVAYCGRLAGLASSDWQGLDEGRGGLELAATTLCYARWCGVERAIEAQVALFCAERASARTYARALRLAERACEGCGAVAAVLSPFATLAALLGPTSWHATTSEEVRAMEVMRDISEQELRERRAYLLDPGDARERCPFAHAAWRAEAADAVEREERAASRPRKRASGLDDAGGTSDGWTTSHRFRRDAPACPC